MSTGSVLEHIKWLNASEASLATSDGRPVFLWKLAVDNDANVWTVWARHFRSQYIADEVIDQLKAGTPHEASRADYLRELIFPDQKVAPGPSIRSGDFCEVLVADLLEADFGFYIPRTRFHQKAIRNESTKGSDVIAIKLESAGTTSANDMLAIYEVKGSLSGKLDDSASRLQDAINDSCKDDMRRAESLNAAKRRLFDSGKIEEGLVIQRFQNALDTPYTYRLGAAAVLSSSCWSEKQLQVTTCQAHPHAETIHLIVIEAENFMHLAHELYRLAADEA